MNVAARARAFMPVLWRALRGAMPDWWDLHIYAGMGAVAAGFWIWAGLPAALIVGGLSVASLGLIVKHPWRR